MSRKLLTVAECSYIQHELGVDNARRQKLVLQRLCGLYGRGYVLPAEAAYRLRQTLGGLITANSTDPKVRRWSLNTIALVGTANDSLAAVLHALDQYGQDPEIMSSAISALVRLDKERFAGIAKSDKFPHEMVLLSGLRTAGPSMIDVRDLRLDIDSAEPEVLKLALLTVGLDCAPEYMFHPSHDNPAIVRALGGHDHPIVSQYSVWAISENRGLGLGDLGIPLNDLEGLRPNIRGWIYRLFAERGDGRVDRHDKIFQGSTDPVSDVRLSLATGLRDTYYDGIEEIVPTWFEDEQDTDTKSLLLEHLVRQAGRFPGYITIVTDSYQKAGFDQRLRMEAAAAGTSMFAEFRRMAYSNQQPLFKFDGDLVLGDKREYNIGSINAGAVSLEGSSTNTGNVQNNLTAEHQAKAREVLAQIADELPQIPLQASQKGELTSAIEEAQKDPNAGTLGKVVSALRSTESALASIAGAGGHLATIGGYIALLVALL